MAISFDYRPADPMIKFLTAAGIDLEQKIESGEHKTYKLTTFAGQFMPLTVEMWDQEEEGRKARFVSVAHYYEQNGDAMRDPEIVFKLYHTDPLTLHELPISYTQDNLGIYREFRQKDSDGIVRFNRPALVDCQKFVKLWARNLKEQGHKIRTSEPLKVEGSA